MGSLSDCVLAWKVSGRSCLMVDLALSSMAHAVYSRTQHHPPAAIEASLRYHRVLRIVQERIAQVGIQRLNEQDFDDCLLAVLLMGRYEGATAHAILNSKRSFTSLQSWSHHDGAMAILKVWNDRLSPHTATDIVKQTRRELIRASLLRNLPLPAWMLDGGRFGEHDIELEFDRIIVRIANLHYLSTRLQQKNSLQITEAEELNNEARELDQALQDWEARIPTTCRYERHTLVEPYPWPRRHLYSSMVFSYLRPGYTGPWSLYFAMRLIVNSTRLRVLNLGRSHRLVDFTYEQQQLECITQLKAMADSLAFTVPFCLERFELNRTDLPISQTSITLNENEEIKPYLAGLLVWPLSIASSVEGIDMRQQFWFRSELAILGKIIGYDVFECAETDRWAIF